ncbi:MAG: glycosyltransferase family 2 protein [Candidatus Hydrogenedentes bacterium]|nr:glycosyltransferase family 2 protein [Candidatus Hydrogenedentota bacterium]
MAKISACVISFNEEKKIEDCLKSLEPVVDEIIVVDSNSTDKTVEIAKRYTDHVHLQDFLGHVQQKDLAVQKASHDWILSLDCDERLSPELQASILAVKDNLGEGGAYRMPRKTFYIYRWLDHCWYPGYKVRLFNKNTCKWGGVNPHDHVVVDGDKVVDLSGDILHYSFDSISGHLQTIDSFTEIAARELIEEGRKVTFLTPLVHANWAFIKIYFLQRGFLDGFAGLSVAVLSCLHVFVKYGKVLMHQKREKAPPP